ncbi:MAG TPA: nitrate/nitrite transporter [Vicinamibacterales bacterium]|nr:nitrate/nitrite transporter [Vicinamibacterales bacterium]
MTEQRTGHFPTLVACFLHFDLSFMLWVLIGALGILIADDLYLSASQRGVLVALPILSGSLMRVPLGLLSDRWGARRVGGAMLAFLFVPLSIGWLGANSWGTMMAVGVMLGTAGASFAVALPLASAWYPPKRQGLVMGVAAAGNSGTVITNLIAPRLSAYVGWEGVFGLAMIPLALVLATFLLIAREAPPRLGAPARPMREVLREADLWWFCLFYSVTFGGYVGLSSFLPLFLRDQQGLAPASAGLLTAVAAFVGSGARPIGGWLADRVGGRRLLTAALTGLAIAYALVAIGPTLPPLTALVIAAMACCGLGNGAVFQLVPLRFRAEIGMVTGVIGAVGGLGGFCLPMLLGVVRQYVGGFGAGFVLLALAAAIVGGALQALTTKQAGWRLSWRSGLSQMAEGA